MASLSYQLLTACWLALLTVTHSILNDGGQARSRQRRDFMTLCEVITTYTGRHCLYFYGYGCYCGPGGEGTPVDGIDRCCQMHDRCYGAKGDGCEHYFVKNKVECRHNTCTCRDAPTSGCPYDLCQCDVQFGECVASQIFNQSYISYNRTLCF